MTRISKMFDARMDRIRSGEKGDKGFTLIELLVVVIIIGILAAIAIPVFLNQRQSAWKASVESDVHNATLAVENFGTSHNGSYTGVAGTYAFGSSPFTTPISLTVSDGNTIVITEQNNGNAYTITGDNTNVGATVLYTYDSSTGKGTWP